MSNRIFVKTSPIEVIEEYDYGYLVQNVGHPDHKWIISKGYVEKYYSEVTEVQNDEQE